jgi:hypothetical membrane protein
VALSLMVGSGFVDIRQIVPATRHLKPDADLRSPIRDDAATPIIAKYRPGESRMRRAGLHLGWIAGALSAAAIVIAGFGLEGFDHARHPVGLLGSSLAPRAGLFNALGFVVPGLMFAGFAVALELQLAPAVGSRAFRIGTGLLLIAALAFALQGLFPIDPRELDGPETRRHALVQAVSQLAWIAAAVVSAIALARDPSWRGIAWAGLLFAGVTLWDLVQPFAAVERGWVERVLLLLWFAWPALLCRRALERRRTRPA